MTFEELTKNSNNNVKSTFKELRKKLLDISGLKEIIRNKNIIYSTFDENFCKIKIGKDYLEIDFKSDNLTEDPIGFSWKIKPTKNTKFDRRMHLKNSNNINLAYELLIQACNSVHI
jgi:hypothetical protein